MVNRRELLLMIGSALAVGTAGAASAARRRRGRPVNVTGYVHQIVPGGFVLVDEEETDGGHNHVHGAGKSGVGAQHDGEVHDQAYQVRKLRTTRVFLEENGSRRRIKFNELAVGDLVQVKGKLFDPDRIDPTKIVAQRSPASGA